MFVVLDDSFVVMSILIDPQEDQTNRSNVVDAPDYVKCGYTFINNAWIAPPEREIPSVPAGMQIASKN